MRVSLSLSVVVLFLTALPASAQRNHNGQRMKDVSWSKTDGEFGAKLFFTNKPDELFEAWNKPTEGVKLPVTGTAVCGKPIVAVVVFTGCGADAKGLAQSTIRLTAYRPDGTMYGEPADGELWVDKPPPPKGQLQLSVMYMGIVIEPEDPLGKYKVVAKVVDNVTGKSLKLSRTFTAMNAGAVQDRTSALRSARQK